jgi:alcohol dehydrogenase
MPFLRRVKVSEAGSRLTWTFHSAGQILFGPGAVGHLGTIAARLGARRLLIVTDRVLADNGVLAQVRRPLAEANVACEVFSGGEPEPSFEAVEAALQAARPFKPDAVLGLGGGSNMDLAKITAAILAHGGGPRDYVGEDRLPGPIGPLVCVPTTAGTGSEVSAAAVLTDRANQMKVGVLSNFLRPRLALVDPLLTVSCPPRVTAIEAYTAVDNATFPLPAGEQTLYQGRHPMGDCLAEKAIALIGANLRRAVARGDDLDARAGMALGATLAGLAFSNVGVALVHALEYPVGGATHCSHGAGNGLLLPYVMRFNLPARRREFARIAELLGEDVNGLSEEHAAGQAITAVDRLRADIGIPERLRDLGVRQDQLRLFAEKAFGIRRILRVNPRQPTVEDLETILHSAY